jgi:hypothetical protein
MQSRFAEISKVVYRWLCCGILFLYASSCTTSGEVVQGQIQLKPWTKTGQSYCAGGSDYLVLISSSEEELVLTGIDQNRFASLDKQKVTLTGQRLNKVIQPDASQPVSQHPVGPDGQAATYSCIVFKVKKIKID